MQSQTAGVNAALSQREAMNARLKVLACYQCKRCTNGCPTTFAMDIYPDEVIRRVILGQLDKVLNCNTIWVCSSCETCTTRCPNEVDIAGVMDYLKELAVRSGVRVPQPRSLAFHQAFFNDIRRRGRIFEGGMMQAYYLKSGELLRKLKDRSIREDIVLAINMFKRGRMPLRPEGIRAKKTVRELMKEAR